MKADVSVLVTKFDYMVMKVIMMISFIEMIKMLISRIMQMIIPNTFYMVLFIPSISFFSNRFTSPNLYRGC